MAAFMLGMQQMVCCSVVGWKEEAFIGVCKTTSNGSIHGSIANALRWPYTSDENSYFANFYKHMSSICRNLQSLSDKEKLALILNVSPGVKELDMNTAMSLICKFVKSIYMPDWLISQCFYSFFSTCTGFGLFVLSPQLPNKPLACCHSMLAVTWVRKLPIKAVCHQI